jgi:pimeloyl-ACP methyl ester carboxylesterase
MPNGAWADLPGSGHLVQEEAADQVADLIRGALRNLNPELSGHEA